MKFNKFVENILAESNKNLYTEGMNNNTQEVQTYEWSGEDGNGMIPVSNGEWVSVDDYRKLLDAYNNANNKNQKLRKVCEMAIDDAVNALEERDLKRRIADEIESRRKELAALTNSTN
jgi:hypothetical protein